MEKVAPNSSESATLFSSSEEDISATTSYNAYSRESQNAPDSSAPLEDKIAYLRESAGDLIEYLEDNNELDTQTRDEITHYAVDLARELEPLARIHAQQLLAKTAIHLQDVRFTDQVHDWIDASYADDSSHYTNHLHGTLDVAATLHSENGVPVEVALSQAPAYLARQQAIAETEARADVAYDPNRVDVNDLREEIVDQIHSIEVTPNAGARHLAIEGVVEMVEELVDHLDKPSTEDVVLTEAVADALKTQEGIDTAENIYKVAEQLKDQLHPNDLEKYEQIVEIVEQRNIKPIDALELVRSAA